jgi:putative DNA primase/helicase
MKIMFPPKPVTHLMKPATGVGKSHEAREQVKNIFSLLPPNTCLVITAPTHNLNDEHLERLLSLLEGVGADVAVYRGRNAKDPSRSGKKMCDFASEASKLAAAGGKPEQLCSCRNKGKRVRCEFHDVCGYRKQYGLTPQVWIAPHALLTKKRPSCIPEIAALINDEDPLQTFFGGFDNNHPVRVSMDELHQARQVPSKQGGKGLDHDRTADLESASAALRRVISTVDSDGIITTKSLIDAGLTTQIATDTYRAILKSKNPIQVSPDMPVAGREKCVQEAAIHNRPILRLARLWKLIGDALEIEQNIVPGCRVERGVQTKDGPQYDAVRLRWLVSLHEDWRKPTIILSATAEPTLLKNIWPQLELVADVNPIAPHSTVTQVLWSASKSKLENDNNLGRIKRYIEVLAFEHKGKAAKIDDRQVDVLAVTQKATKENLIALTLPENVDAAHFNAVEGIDKWGEVAGQIVVGRTMPPPNEVELMAEVLTGEVVDRDGVEFPGGWYPRKVVGIRMSGGGEVGHPTLAEYHPDTICEAIRRNICEGGLTQAIGRSRAVNRTEANPIHTVIVGTMPLALSVDEVLTADAIEPDPLILMASRGLLVGPNAKHGKWAVIQKVLSDRFDSEQAARHTLTRSNANIEYLLANERVSEFMPAKVKLAGSRYAVLVLIDASQGDLREVAERLLGPLDSFEVVNKAPTAPTQPKPVPPADTVTDIAPSQATYSKHDVRKGLDISRQRMNQLLKRRGIRELQGKEQERALVEAMMMVASPKKVVAFAASLSGR